MNHKIAQRFERARRYLERIREDMRKSDPVQAMADCAELHYQATELYKEFQKAYRNNPMNPHPDLTEINQILLAMECRCGHYPRRYEETLWSDPPIVTYFYRCRCGNQTGNFLDVNDAKLCWQARFTWLEKNQKNA